MSFLGIDIGSSYIKAAILDPIHSRLMHSHRRVAPERNPVENPHFFEVEPMHILETVVSILDELLKTAHDVEGILLSTQMHGFVVCTQDALPVSPYISWQDSRSLLPYCPESPESSIEYLVRNIPRGEQSRTGISLKPKQAVCNLHHWASTHQDLLDRKSSLMFCTLGSFLIHQLTGRNACHITNAAATGFMDLPSGAWNKNIIRIAGCGTLRFPEILPEHSACGYYQGSGVAVPIYPDIGDHQASVYGTAGLDPDKAVLSGGTGGIAARVIEGFTTGEFECRPYFKGKYLSTVTQLPGGRNMDVLMDFIENVGRAIYQVSPDRRELWKAVFRAIAEENGNPSAPLPKVNLQFFSTSPGADDGRIAGIRDGNLTVSSLFRGAFDSMADAFASALKVLAIMETPIKQIVLTGGIFRENDYLKKSIEKQTGIQAVFSGLQDEALYGLLRLSQMITEK
ncbi:MAG TPA: hypothetical protein DCY35_07165 [Prolixibacteraceae bacterium]|nr:hypothetical protein [Prolixibacteraceae bacterium]